MHKIKYLIYINYNYELLIYELFTLNC